jgi:hypothetical protein
MRLPATGDRMLAQLGELIDGTDTWSATRRAELHGVISTKLGLNRYLRVTPGWVAAHRPGSDQSGVQP